MNSNMGPQSSTSTAATDTEETDEAEISLQSLATEVQSLRDEVTALREENERLEQTVKTQSEQLDAMEERIEELEQAKENSDEHRKHLQRRLHALESDSGETENPSADGNDDEPSTPLGRILQLSKKVLQQKLSANQQRALFIAKDIREYAQQVPAGFAVQSGTIRKVLRAKEGQTPHTQTISRVMEFLDRLGKEHVRVVKRRGTKRVVFTETAVDRLSGLARKSSTGVSENGSGITDVVIGGR